MPVDLQALIDAGKGEKKCREATISRHPALLATTLSKMTILTEISSGDPWIALRISD